MARNKARGGFGCATSGLPAQAPLLLLFSVEKTLPKSCLRGKHCSNCSSSDSEQ